MAVGLGLVLALAACGAAPTAEPETTIPSYASEIYILMRDVADTFNGGRFYLRGRTIVPEHDFSPAVDTPIVMAGDGSRSVLEQTLDWAQHDAEQAEALQSTFGNTMRMLIERGGSTTIFPERDAYFSFGNILGDEMYMMEFDPVGIDGLHIPFDIAYVHATYAGRTYLATTLPVDGGMSTFFFHNNQLRRMETVAFDGGLSIIEIDTLHRNPPESLFSTAQMQSMPLNDVFMFMEVWGPMF